MGLIRTPSVGRARSESLACDMDMMDCRYASWLGSA